MRTRIAVTLAALLTASSLAGCGAAAGDDGEFTVVTSFYPLQYLAERIAGDAARVSNLTKPGVEPHDLELSPDQVGAVTEADLLVYLKGFQPAVDDAAKQLADASRTYDVAGTRAFRNARNGRGDQATDPHVWLDPLRYGELAQALGRKLGEVDPDHKAGYAKRAKDLVADLTTLHREYDTGLADCERRELVVSHAAFGYLASAYDLEQISIAGLSPEQEPSPKRLSEITDLVKRHDVQVIFYETLASPRLAKTVANEAGVEAKPLDPLEGLKPDSSGDYFSVMRRNLASIRTALDCS